jgi:hypothetical protein
MDEKPVWDVASPLHLVECPDFSKEILTCARVGLSLRAAKSQSSGPSFLTRPYRFLSEPKRIAKGKVLMVLGMHRAGRSVHEIRKKTGCPLWAIRIYIEEYEAGRSGGRFEDYLGKELGPRDLCRLHGIADRS